MFRIGQLGFSCMHYGEYVCTPTIWHWAVSIYGQPPPIPVLALVNFNGVLDTSLDILRKFCPQGNRVPTALARYILELELVDLWRCKYPLKAQFSCHSLTHSTLSCIDLALGTDLSFAFNPTVQYMARGLSDHSPMQITLSLHSSKLPMHWKLNLFWFPLFNNTDHMRSQIRGFLIENRHSTSSIVMWDILKVYIRGICIQELSAIKASSRQWAIDASEAVDRAEQAYLNAPNPLTEKK